MSHEKKYEDTENITTLISPSFKYHYFPMPQEQRVASNKQKIAACGYTTFNVMYFDVTRQFSGGARICQECLESTIFNEHVTIYEIGYDCNFWAFNKARNEGKVK